jgi:hypothetical protein
LLFLPAKTKTTHKEKSFKTLLLQVLKEGGNHLPSSTGIIIIIIIINNTQNPLLSQEKVICIQCS